MPQTKNGTRWKPRIKQQEAIEKIKAKPFGKYLFVLPGGYGKTKAAIGAYCAARDSGAVNRLLVVAPSREQRDAWLDCYEDFQQMEQPVRSFSVDGVDGVRYSFCATDVGGCTWAYQRHRKNECEVFVITIQSLCSAGGKSAVNALLETGRWMVVAEEAHHYAVDKQWGNAINDLYGEILIGLSATPFRQVGEHVFSSIMKDDSRVVECSISDAINEGAIRPIRVKQGQYQVEFQTSDRSETFAFKLAELSSYLYEHNLDLSAFEAKKDLRVLDQFVKPIFLQALDQLDRLNDQHPGQHQMIVHAPSVLTAKVYCNWINLLTNNFYGQAAYWVGTGADQTDKENRKIIADFKANKFPILVQVQMFGEGSDNIRASVGLWLSLLGSDNASCWQGMVRHSRRNYAIPQSEDIAYLFIPEDSPGFERAMLLQSASSDFWDPAMEAESKGDGETKLGQLNIPGLEEMERRVRASAAELINVLSAEDYSRKMEEARKTLQADSHEITLNLQRKTGLSREAAENIAEKLITERLEGMLMGAISRANQKATEEQIHQEWAYRVESLVKRISRHVAQKLHPYSVEKSTIATLDKAMIGVLKKKINGQLKKANNNKGRKESEVSDLKRQYDFLAKTANSIDTGTIPTWLTM